MRIGKDLADKDVVERDQQKGLGMRPVPVPTTARVMRVHVLAAVLVVAAAELVPVSCQPEYLFLVVEDDVVAVHFPVVRYYSSAISMH